MREYTPENQETKIPPFTPQFLVGEKKNTQNSYLDPSVAPDNPTVTFFFACMLLPPTSSTTTRLDELGGSHTLLGVSRLVMCLAEMPFFYVSGPMIRHMGARGVIGLSQVAYLTRFLYYSVRVSRGQLVVLFINSVPIFLYVRTVDSRGMQR